MVFRWIVSYVLSNEKFLKKITNSYVVRLAAQITAYCLHRGKEIGRKKIKHITKSKQQIEGESSTSKTGTAVVKKEKVVKTFLEAFEEQWKNEEIKRQKKKEEKKKKKLDET